MLTSALEPILVVTIPRVGEMFKSVLIRITYWTDFKLVNLLPVEHAKLTNHNLNTNTAEPDDGCNNRFVPYDTLISGAKR